MKKAMFLLSVLVLSLSITSCNNYPFSDHPANSPNSATNENGSRLQAKKGWILVNSSETGNPSCVYTLTFLENGKIINNYKITNMATSRNSMQTVGEYCIIGDSLIEISLSFRDKEIDAIRWKSKDSFELKSHERTLVFQATNDDYNPILGK